MSDAESDLGGSQGEMPASPGGSAGTTFDPTDSTRAGGVPATFVALLPKALRDCADGLEWLRLKHPRHGTAVYFCVAPDAAPTEAPTFMAVEAQRRPRGRRTTGRSPPASTPACTEAARRTIACRKRGVLMRQEADPPRGVEKKRQYGWKQRPPETLCRLYRVRRCAPRM